MTPLIRLDHREMHTKLGSRLHSISTDVEITTLEQGDIEIGARIIIERKCYNDLCRSIQDGRLFSQMHRLAATAPRPILLIEGGDEADSPVHRNAVSGALSHIAIELGIPTISTDGVNETVELLESLANRESVRGRRRFTTLEKRLRTIDAGDTLHARYQRLGSGLQMIRSEVRCIEAVENLLHDQSTPGRKGRAIHEVEQVRVLESYPGIGPVSARRLLDRFGNLSSVLAARCSELIEAGLPTAVATRFHSLNHQ